MYPNGEGTLYPIEKELCVNTERPIPFGEQRATLLKSVEQSGARQCHE